MKDTGHSRLWRRSGGKRKTNKMVEILICSKEQGNTRIHSKALKDDDRYLHHPSLHEGAVPVVQALSSTVAVAAGKVTIGCISFSCKPFGFPQRDGILFYDAIIVVLDPVNP